MRLFSQRFRYFSCNIRYSIKGDGLRGKRRKQGNYKVFQLLGYFRPLAPSWSKLMENFRGKVSGILGIHKRLTGYFAALPGTLWNFELLRRSFRGWTDWDIWKLGKFRILETFRKFSTEFASHSRNS